MQINFVYDSSVTNAPTSLKTALAAAAAYLDTLITNPITVNIQVGWGEDNGAAIPTNTLSTGGPQQDGIGMTYAQLKSALDAHVSGPQAATIRANLPATDPTNGGMFYITAAQQKAWGLLPTTGTEIDGNIGFASNQPWTFDPNNRAAAGLYDFIGDAEAEISHALGRFAGLQTSAPGWYSPLDLFRFAEPGVYQTTLGPPAFFSIDGGHTALQTFDTTGDPSDWAAGIRGDVFGQGYTGQTMAMTSTDETVLSALGYNLTTPAPAPTPTPTPLQSQILSLANVEFGAPPTPTEAAKAATMLISGNTLQQVALSFMSDPRYAAQFATDTTASSFVHAVFAGAHVPATSVNESSFIRSLANHALSRADILVAAAINPAHTAYMAALPPVSSGYTVYAPASPAVTLPSST